uniref:Uncharacterized protein n=1 Tax=Solanum tuberosum TaxID=4113 RepID=M1B685_SOLTU
MNNNDPNRGSQMKSETRSSAWQLQSHPFLFSLLSHIYKSQPDGNQITVDKETTEQAKEGD